MTGPAVVRPPWSWVVTMVGFVLQTVAAVGAVAVLVAGALDSHRQSEEAGGFAHDGFLDGIGAFFGAVLALLVGLFALAMVVVLWLSARPGTRRQAGLILGVCLLLPVGWGTVGASSDGVGALEVAATLGIVLVLIGIAVPTTWRYARRPAAPATAPPHPPWPTPG